MAGGLRICIVSASGQNVFFAEILDAFAEALRGSGFEVESAVDHFPAPASDLVCLYVPHEFHPLVDLLAHPTPMQLRRTVAVCTEQPGSSWFELSADLAAKAGAIVDINVLGVQALGARGLDVDYTPLGYVPAWDAWHGEDSREREVDLAFLGAYTPRRGALLARCAPVLRDYRSEIHLVDSAQPHTAFSRSFVARERKWRLLANTKILLNIHQDPRPYMEWHRVVGAAVNGCVVLSENSIGNEPFEPGEHIVFASYDHLPSVLAGLLCEPQRVERIRRAAYELLRERVPGELTAEALIRAVTRAAAEPVLDGNMPLPGPMPIPMPPRKPGWETEAEAMGDQRPIRTALKHLVTQTRRLERQLHRLQRGPSVSEEPEIEHFGPARPEPRASVLLTIYNYADYVPEALRSVALSELENIEVIAVDDASTDHSVDAVRETCADLPWLNVRLVRRPTNHGLSAARNLAAEHAKADFLFVLDADNMVLPHGLERLASALDSDPEASFAYGIIETFGLGGPTGLLSWPDWDPSRLRFGNYIDAMAMIRRSALEAAGGYTMDAALSMGWEDFALWVAMAHLGMRGIRIPDFVARYRVNPHSMLSLTDIDNSAVWATLLRRYPSLAAPMAADPSGISA